MTKVLKAFTSKAPKETKGRKYDTLLDGKIYSILPRDFKKPDLRKLQACICTAAYQRGLIVKTQQVGTRLEVQMTGKRGLR